MIRITRPLYKCGKGLNILQNVQQPHRTCVVQTFRTEEIQGEENKNLNERKDPKCNLPLVNLAFSRIEAPEQSLCENKLRNSAKKSDISVSDCNMRERFFSEKVTKVPHIGNAVGLKLTPVEAKLLSCAEAVQLLKILSVKKDRPVKLLNDISYKICIEAESLSIKECSNVLFYLASLSFTHEVLIDKIALVILNKSSEFYSGSLPASILESLGILKYKKNSQLIDCLVKIIISDESPKRLELFLKALVSAAKLNYVSPYIKVLLNEILKSEESDFQHTKSYLDFVWACVLLNELSVKHISTVLSEKFIDQLHIIEGTSGLKKITIWKLLNVNAAAKNLLPFYTGPFLKGHHTGVQFTKTKSQLLESVVDGLSYIFPKNEFLKIKEDTGAGFLLEVECYLNLKGNPVPLLVSKEEGVYKIGILLLDFNDVCINEGLSLTGLSSFKERILTARGYKVVSIPYTEYNDSLKLFQKVQYLRKKLQSAISV